MNAAGRTLIIVVVVVAALQLARPSIPEKPATDELRTPPQVKRILETSCYSCHSDQRRLSWFDEIVPAYWLVRADVLTARQHLNFSTLGAKPPAAQKAALYEAVNMIQLGAMPLPRFLRLHPEAKLSAEDLNTLKAYLAPWSPLPNPAERGSHGSGTLNPPSPTARISLSDVQPEPNGFSFDPSFEAWKPISTTDRGDNNTFRFILGNEIAVKAAQSGNVSPWPYGTRFAKIAWQQEMGTDGLIHPGTFVQVELMLKDAGRYKSTDGWGWGRWRGLNLTPYGNSAQFVNECTTCHMPVRGNDYVYTLPMTTARVSGEEVVNNRAADLPANLPYQPLSWSAITMYVDPNRHTTATLYGNDVAIQAVRASAKSPRETVERLAYPANSVLALVTWEQRDDPHWFGARIPNIPSSVEFVEVGLTTSYQRFAGTGLAEVHVTDLSAAERISFVAGLAPAQLP